MLALWKTVYKYIIQQNLCINTEQKKLQFAEQKTGENIAGLKGFDLALRI